MGPLSRAVLSELTETDLSPKSFPFFTVKEMDMGSASGIRAMNLTHTGEMGWVLYIPNEAALHVYDKIMEHGRKYAIQHAGYLATRSLRLVRSLSVKLFLFHFFFFCFILELNGFTHIGDKISMLRRRRSSADVVSASNSTATLTLSVERPYLNKREKVFSGCMSSSSWTITILRLIRGHGVVNRFIAMENSPEWLQQPDSVSL